MNIVLASTSPRRQELLKRIVKKFDIVGSSFNEAAVPFGGEVDKYVCELAEGKVKAVLSQIHSESIVIGCDTVVYNNDEILGKPSDELEAFRMLKSLSGNTHKVYSGIVLINSVTNEIIKKSVCTEVKFMKLSDDMIWDYIGSGQCFGKAGAYGIQDNAAIFVEGIKGCYYNVVGLSLNNVFLMLREMGVNL